MYPAAMVAALLSLPAYVVGTELEPPSAGVDMVQAKCLERAALVESSSAKEPFEATLAVVEALHQRTLDGRWGSTDCDTVYKKYPSVKNHIVRVRAKVAIGKKTIWRKIARTVRKLIYIHDVSGMSPRFNKVKGTDKQQHEARLASLLVLSGGYTAPTGFEHMLHYQYPQKSDKDGASWFSCVTTELGKIHAKSLHVFYADATETVIAERYESKPACRTYIDRWRIALSRKKDYKPAPPPLPVPVVGLSLGY